MNKNKILNSLTNKSLFKFLLHLFIYYTCVHLCAHMPWYTCRSQRTTFKSNFSPFTMLVLGINQVVKLGCKCLTHWVISLAPGSLHFFSWRVICIHSSYLSHTVKSQEGQFLYRGETCFNQKFKCFKSDVFRHIQAME